MDWATIIVALVLAAVAWKVLMGLIKFAVVALIVVAALYFLSDGGFLA